MTQGELDFDRPPTFDGETYDHDRDNGRLRRQLGLVRDLMSDGEWRTLEKIAAATESPEPSVSARLRDLRKAKFGGYIVQRRYVSRGLFEYRVVPS